MGCILSFYATVFSIRKLQTFDSKWFSHKQCRAELRYEIKISIASKIVLMNGPFACGSHLDF